MKTPPLPLIPIATEGATDHQLDRVNRHCQSFPGVTRASQCCEFSSA